MPLVTMKEILQKADQSNYGVGSFNVVNMETVIGVIKAAEETNSPIILQAAEARLRYSPLNLIGPIMVAAAQKAKVPVAVHFDHGSRPETIKQALDFGFTSVMFDGSGLSLEENAAKTIEVIRLAKRYGASVEAEIGRVGGSEDGLENIEMAITQVQDAKEFFERTEVDALAVAIGNVHGVYKSEPNLQFERLKGIDEVVAAPLVLHGGSGITVHDFRRCIQYGIKKINVQTATLNKVVERVRALCQQNEKLDYFTYHQCIINAACESAKGHIEAFQSNNQA
ncbi:putative fructose-bisphosphate aldolase [Sporomusa silvacetica DSM 10669]|uniref:Fructose-bisphosphate aldolase n=1 Tax=Sporomusa silvacetica DSM 10669 TaxID=1123289 RepID=A0ABZ3IMC1_9FIRM|nr:class II fructose-bisphosphate aldolase [Sporomusa silvacetica]OZC14354.1 putative fructose-bisphosphate aldolase [Sporomusa silvacetica DSM 10669]